MEGAAEEEFDVFGEGYFVLAEPGGRTHLVCVLTDLLSEEVLFSNGRWQYYSMCDDRES